MARNDGEHPISEMFPGIAVPAGTGAPGSMGADASGTTGPVIGTPAISVPGASSQLAANRPTAAVHSGDTSGMPDDLAAPAGPILPGPQAAYSDTGAGSGHTVNRHPNAGM